MRKKGVKVAQALLLVFRSQSGDPDRQQQPLHKASSLPTGVAERNIYGDCARAVERNHVNDKIGEVRLHSMPIILAQDFLM